MYTPIKIMVPHGTRLHEPGDKKKKIPFHPKFPIQSSEAD